MVLCKTDFMTILVMDKICLSLSLFFFIVFDFLLEIQNTCSHLDHQEVAPDIMKSILIMLNKKKSKYLQMDIEKIFCGIIQNNNLSLFALKVQL